MTEFKRTRRIADMESFGHELGKITCAGVQNEERRYRQRCSTAFLKDRRFWMPLCRRPVRQEVLEPEVWIDGEALFTALAGGRC